MSDPAAGIPPAEVFGAYQSCRHHKRRTHNALAFELDYEGNLVALWRDMNSGACRPARSIAFIVERPVKREIFAADFRDRVVHGDSYARRVGKGTHMGIRRVDRFIQGFFSFARNDAGSAARWSSLDRGDAQWWEPPSRYPSAGSITDGEDKNPTSFISLSRTPPCSHDRSG